MIPSSEQFWQFSEQYYARPGIAEACLELQDEHGANVNLLLLIIMLDARGFRAEHSPLLALVEQRRPLFEQWRQLRRQLKAQLPTDDYLQLLQHEVALEAWQQQELLQGLIAHPPQLGTGGLLAYLHHLKLTDAPLWQLKLAG